MTVVETPIQRDGKVPVTVLTGFLGSGKTTLLNRILTEQHGKRIAVIENEFGDIGIDQELVINADEEIFEMNNGCICCTVRGDLIRILGNLMRRKDAFDHILFETTGLADPAPGGADLLRRRRDEGAAPRSTAIVTVVDAQARAPAPRRQHRVPGAGGLRRRHPAQQDRPGGGGRARPARGPAPLDQPLRPDVLHRTLSAASPILGVGAFDLSTRSPSTRCSSTTEHVHDHHRLGGPPLDGALDPERLEAWIARAAPRERHRHLPHEGHPRRARPPRTCSRGCT